MKSSLHISFTTLALLALAAVSVFGQAITGSIVGNVTDASGAAVAGAKITITETSTGISRTAISNAEGGYVMPYLQPGTYKVEVEKSGFKKSSASEVRLATGQSVRINAVLEVGQITETIEVSNAASLLQTESADI